MSRPKTKQMKQFNDLICLSKLLEEFPSAAYYPTYVTFIFSRQHTCFLFHYENIENLVYYFIDFPAGIFLYEDNYHPFSLMLFFVKYDEKYSPD